MRSPTSSVTDVWHAIAAGAAAESSLWGQAVLDEAEQRRIPVFSPLAESRFALGVETIYEGYLAHYGRPRLFRPPDADTALLLGDYLYAHGLVRIADLGDVDAVRELAELISRCAYLRADGLPGDGDAWIGTVVRLSGDAAADTAARTAALAAHARLVG